MSYEKIQILVRISYIDGNLVVPNNPIIPEVMVLDMI